LVIIALGSQLVTRKGFTGITFIDVRAKSGCDGSLRAAEPGGRAAKSFQWTNETKRYKKKSETKAARRALVARVCMAEQGCDTSAGRRRS
jgi:hypothetical protein